MIRAPSTLLATRFCRVSSRSLPHLHSQIWTYQSRRSCTACYGPLARSSRQDHGGWSAKLNKSTRLDQRSSMRQWPQVDVLLRNRTIVTTSHIQGIKWESEQTRILELVGLSRRKVSRLLLPPKIFFDDGTRRIDFMTRGFHVARLRNTAAETRYCWLFIVRLIYRVFVVLLFAAEAELDLFYVLMWPVTADLANCVLQWKLLGVPVNTREI